MKGFLLFIFGAMIFVGAVYFALDRLSMAVGSVEVGSSEYKKVREAVKKYPDLRMEACRMLEDNKITFSEYITFLLK